MASDNEDVSMEIPSGSLASIAQPLAGKKLHKKLLKLVKKGKTTLDWMILKLFSFYSC
jgi:hypothetical protein